MLLYVLEHNLLLSGLTESFHINVDFIYSWKSYMQIQLMVLLSTFTL